MKNVKLITCNGVRFDLQLLSHHIEHYLSFGILPENYLLILNGNNKEDIQPGIEVANRYNIKNVFHWLGTYSSQEMHGVRNKVITKHSVVGDWIMHADADEFHWYDEPVENIIKMCKKTNSNCVQGVFTDRITNDGSLPEINIEPQIYEQMPVLANLNKIWFPNTDPKSGVVKMMLYDARLRSTRGGHQIAHEQQRVAKYLFGMDLSKHPDLMKTEFREYCPYHVHHFKWHSNVINKLQERVLNYKKMGFKWWVTSQRFIDYYNTHGKISIDMVEIYEDQSKSFPISKIN